MNETLSLPGFPPGSTPRPLMHYRKRLPSRKAGSLVSLSTVFRWVVKGIDTEHGRVRLKALRAGNTWLCCDEWFAEFTAALTRAAIPADTCVRSPAARKAEAEAAGKELAKAGW